MAATLIHWNAGEGRERARLLRQAGFEVRLEFDSHRGPQILKQWRASSPDAVIISLDRLPMHGRDLGVALRTGKQTRLIPLLFVGGEAAKVERVRQVLPDVPCTTWANLAQALKRALGKPPLAPVVPSSNLAGYSGTPLPKKLGIKPDISVTLLQEPESFLELLEPLPSGVRIAHRLAPSTAIAIWFVRSGAELASQIESVAGQVAAAASCRLWIAWPKRTSPLATDVNEAMVRVSALAAGLVDYKVAAIDADWSGLLFAPRRPGRSAGGR